MCKNCNIYYFITKGKITSAYNFHKSKQYALFLANTSMSFERQQMFANTNSCLSWRCGCAEHRASPHVRIHKHVFVSEKMLVLERKTGVRQTYNKYKNLQTTKFTTNTNTTKYELWNLYKIYNDKLLLVFYLSKRFQQIEYILALLV